MSKAKKKGNKTTDDESEDNKVQEESFDAKDDPVEGEDEEDRDDEILELWKRYKKLENEENLNKLTSYLDPISGDAILKIINKRAKKAKPIFVLLTALLKATAAPNTEAMATDDITHKNKTIRRKLFKHIIYLSYKGKSQEADLVSCINSLKTETGELDNDQIQESITMIHDAIERSGDQTNGEFLDLLPPLLTSIEKFAKPKKKSDEQGRFYWIERLCKLDWPHSLLVKLIDTLREAPLDKKELELIFKKSLSLLSLPVIQDYPSFIFKLLILSSKGHKELILRGISNFFAKQDTICDLKTGDSESEVGTQSAGVQQVRLLLETEGTALLQLDMAFKQDPELANSFIRLFKAEDFTMTSFAIAVLLSTARIQRYQTSVFQILKTAVGNCFKEANTDSHRSGWFLSFKELIPPPIAVYDALLSTLTKSADAGWEYVVQSFVYFAIMLMDSHTINKLTNDEPNNKIIDLGITILENTFKAHSSVRAYVMDQIFSRIITKSEYVPQYISLLSKIIQNSDSKLLDDYTDKFKEAFDYIGYLSPLVVQNFLIAVGPVFVASQGLQDYVMIVLRKCLFSRELDARVNAVLGFLFILKSALQKEPPNGNMRLLEAHNKKLMNTQHEIISFLRRCLSQQAEIRDCLYTGFADLFKASKNSSVRQSILEILHQQFMIYYSDDEKAAPLNLELCIEKSEKSAGVVKIIEPLPSLLSCIQKCLLLTKTTKKEDSDDTSSQQSEGQSRVMDELKGALSNITDRFGDKNMLADFELDKTSDYSNTTTTGKFNSAAAGMLIGVYKVLIEHWTLFQTIDVDSWSKILKMYKGLSEVESAKKSGKKTGEKKLAGADSAAAGNKKGRKPSTSAGESTEMSYQFNMFHENLGMDTIYAFIVLLDPKLFETDSGIDLEVVEQFTTNNSFQSFIFALFKTELTQLNKLIIKSPHSLQVKINERLKSKVFNLVRTSYKTLLDAAESLAGGKGHLIYECFQLAVQYMTYYKTYRNKNHSLPKLLEATLPEDEQTESSYKNMHLATQRLITNMIAKIDKDQTKDAEVYSEIIKDLIEEACFRMKAPADERKEVIQGFEEAYDRLCRTKIESTPVSKNIFTTYLDLIGSDEDLEKITNLCKEIKDNDTEEGEYQIINAETKNVLVTSIMTTLQSYTQEVNLVMKSIQILKSRHSLKTKNAENEEEDEEEEEEDEEAADFDEEKLLKIAYQRLHQLGKVVEIVIQSQVGIDMMEAVLKLSVDLYSSVGLAAKRQLAASRKKKREPLQKEFHSLVEFFGGLTQKVYEYLIHVSESQKAQQVKQTKSKIRKEGALWPKLIFAIENFEASIISLSDLTKTSLIKGFKKSASRDFKILLDNINNNEEDGGEDDVKPKKGTKRKKAETKTPKEKKVATKKAAATKPKAGAKGKAGSKKQPAKKKLKTN
eukprot:TRINITY_DN5841_c0_g1_i1.p1 TRINITY_DN5841_c0_g1~~TRINITY_DN5841_c0_g1_i1.p1  ORF type:complete len:1419 (-),score=238.06 TRINITY_DN5841_c0_g1_i1:262-4518(-)